MRAPRRTIAAALVAVFVATVGMGIAFAASFSDTAASPFSTEIDHIAFAGCASGFPDGTYRPTQPVNRQQMAAFINRCGGRIAHTNGTTVNTSSSGTFVNLAQVTITPGGLEGVPPCGDSICAGSTGNIIRFTGSAHAATGDEGHCPCDVDLRILVDDDGIIFDCDTNTRQGDLVNAGGDDGIARIALEVGATCEAKAGQARTATLQARYNDATVSGVAFIGEITAHSTPFGGDGSTNL